LPLKTQIPDSFSYLLISQISDESLSKNHGDNQGGDYSHGGSERDVLKHSRSRKSEIFIEILKEVV
jgi:hypothetical protein